MKQLLLFLKKMHTVAGFKLYFHFVGMMLVSSLEGLSVYLLAPLLGFIGILSGRAGDIPFVSVLDPLLGQMPESAHLPLVLAVYLGIVLTQAVLQRNMTIHNQKIQQGFIKTLRLETYQALLEADWNFYLQKRRSDLNHLMTHELANISQGATLAMRLATTFLFTAIQIGFALWLSVKLTALVIVSGVLLALFSRRFVRTAKRLGERTTKLSQDYMGGLSEHFNGIKDIKANMLEEHHFQWFREMCRNMESNYLQFARLQSTSQLFYKAASAVLIALFVLLSFRVFQAEPGHLMLIMVIFTRLWPKFTGIQASWEQIVSSYPAFRNLASLLQECAAAKEQAVRRAGRTALAPLRPEKEIFCRNLYYRYGKDQPYAIRDVSLVVPANRVTAIVGKSGAGKSTLVDLLTGLVQPEQGEILVDGAPLTDERLSRFRRSVSYVAQDPFLFHASIRDNLRMVAPFATESKLWEALAFSASAGFVEKLPDGLDTVIGDRGIRLSGGERQRLVLARAILRNPAILVMDEATSALDSENEAKIQEALNRIKGSMTVIVIAHRLSTIRNADQVVVLEEGQIVRQEEFLQLSLDDGKLLSK
ncbi:MAG TPA: ABC transporter ATP-binding protein [Bacilli bacterium]